MAPSSRCALSKARHSNSTGARTGQSSPASAPSCRRHKFQLNYSLAFFLCAYLLRTHEMLFDAHHHAFVAWGGIPRRGIYDNMKTAVDRARQRKLRDVNLRFSTMVSHNRCRVLQSGLEEGGDREERGYT